jgi:hypothetical protein
VILIDVPFGHHISTVTEAAAWEFDESGIQLVAEDARLKLRRLRRRKDAVEVIAPGGKVEKTLTGAPVDFIWFGLVVWRGGVIARLKPQARLNLLHGLARAIRRPSQRGSHFPLSDLGSSHFQFQLNRRLNVLQ